MLAKDFRLGGNSRALASAASWAEAIELGGEPLLKKNMPRKLCIRGI